MLGVTGAKVVTARRELRELGSRWCTPCSNDDKQRGKEREILETERNNCNGHRHNIVFSHLGREGRISPGGL